MNAIESAMTSTMSTLDLYEAKVEELHIALREHQAYKECIEFEGDVCDTCVELIEDIDAAMFDIEEWNRISTYNTRYVEYVRYVAARAPLTTNTLVVANIVATTGVMPSEDDEDEANAAAYEAHDEEARFAWVLRARPPRSARRGLHRSLQRALHVHRQAVREGPQRVPPPPRPRRGGRQPRG